LTKPKIPEQNAEQTTWRAKTDLKSRGLDANVQHDSPARRRASRIYDWTERGLLRAQRSYNEPVPMGSAARTGKGGSKNLLGAHETRSAGGISGGALWFQSNATDRDVSRENEARGGNSRRRSGRRLRESRTFVIEAAVSERSNSPGTWTEVSSPLEW